MPEQRRPRIPFHIWGMALGLAVLYGLIAIRQLFPRSSRPPDERIAALVVDRTRQVLSVEAMVTRAPCSVLIARWPLRDDVEHRDPWDRALVITCRDHPELESLITVISAGADGVFGTDDDHGAGDGWCDGRRGTCSYGQNP